MIDFVKIIVHVDDVHEFLCKVGDPKQKVNTNTGELEPIYEVEVQNLEFKGYETGTIKIMGSLHKYFNQGKHNHDDFTYNKLVESIHMIFDRFNIPFKEIFLKNVEFGVNILPPVAADSIVNGLVMHKRSMFKDISLNIGNYRQVEYKQYFVKAYNKGIQYKLDYPVFRFEIKVRTMQNIKRYGFKTLADLLDHDKLRRMGPWLAYHWDKVLLIDPTIDTQNLSLAEKTRFLQWSNPNYWRDIINNPTKNKLANQKIAFNNFTISHSHHIQPVIKALILNKWQQLLSS